MKKIIKIMLSVFVLMTCLTLTTKEVNAASYPSIFIQPSDSTLTIAEGDSGYFKFNIYPEYYNERYHVEVYDSDGAKIASKTSTYYNSDGTFVKTLTLTFDKNSMNVKAGTYKIVYWLDYYSYGYWHTAPYKYTYQMTVYEKMKINTQPKSAYAKLNEKVKVSVKASGEGLKYTWYVKSVGATKYSKSSVTSSTYSVKMTEKVKDRYVYCIVKDKYGNELRTKTVKLNMKASIAEQPQNVSAALGKKAKIKFTALGDGLTYEWYVKNKSDSKFKKISNTKATYNCEVTSKTNGRKVYCVVTDKHGYTVTTKTITVTKK